MQRNNLRLLAILWTAAIQSVTSPNDSGTYKIGDWIFIDVNFDNPVDVTGTPKLHLATGPGNRNANYLYGGGTSTLTFAYQVQSGDETADLDYSDSGALTLNGGTIKTWSLLDADLTLPTPGQTGSLSANADIVLDTPCLTANGASTVNKGSPYTLQLSMSNLGSHDQQLEGPLGHAYSDIYNYTTNQLQVTHIYRDGNRSRVIEASAILEDGSLVPASDISTIALYVVDVGPYLNIQGNTSAAIGSPYTLHLSASDPGNESIRHWTINWGDGNIQTVPGNPNQVTHYYAVAGTYNISATGTQRLTNYTTGGGDASSLDVTFGSGGNAIVSSVANVINGWSGNGRSIRWQDGLPRLRLCHWK